MDLSSAVLGKSRGGYKPGGWSDLTHQLVLRPGGPFSRRLEQVGVPGLSLSLPGSPHHLSSMVTLGHQISYYQLRDPDVHVPGEPERRHTTVYNPVWEAVPGYCRVTSATFYSLKWS